MPDAPTVNVTSVLAPGKLILRTMIMVDGLSSPFEMQVDLLCPDYDLDFDKVLGTGLTIEMTLVQDKKRYFHGLIADVAFAGSSGRYAIYKATLRPWLWFLTRAADCRIFQNQSVPDIILDGVFRPRDFTDFERKLSKTYNPREYCVQYRESDFNFACRLMEEEGIYYYYKHENNKHTLVLCDSVSAHDKVTDYNDVTYFAQGDIASYEREGMMEWFEARAVLTGSYILTDYDFEKPRTDLEVRSVAPAAHAQAKMDVFDYPGEYRETSQGQTYADVRREELQIRYQRYRGRGNPRGLGTGHLFKLKSYPREAYNKEYLLTSVRHELHSLEYEMGTIPDQPSYRFWTEFEAMDSQKPFRPPRVTPKAVVRGPQTAVVVGPTKSEGADGKPEIYTDKYGRVKLKFRWDRHNTKDDENSSCWIRVSNAWAGKKWGQIFLPRMGQEVIVDFLEGDPDQPIVTGRVYNADQMPPYDLPDDRTKSTLKTRSSTKGEDTNFNELRFEDKKDKEEIYFHAERDFNRVVENNDTLKVGFEKKDEGNQTIDIYNNQTITIGTDGCKDGSQTITIFQNRSSTIEKGDETLKISMGNRTETIKGNDSLTLQAGNQTIDIKAGSQSTTAMQSITLKVGGNSITIDQQGISIKGIKVEVAGSAAVEVSSSAQTQVVGTATLTLQGGMVKIN